MEEYGDAEDYVPSTEDFSGDVPHNQIKLAKFLTTEDIDELDLEDLTEEEKRIVLKHYRRIKRLFYPYMGRLMMLSKISPEEAQNILFRLEMEVRSYLSSIPRDEITFQFIIAIDNLFTRTEIALMSARDGFYRKQLDTKIVTTQTMHMTDAQQPVGLLGKLFGFGRR